MARNVAANVVGAYDAKARFSQLLERVANGEEFTITRHGMPVAKLVPVKTSVPSRERMAAIRRWQETSRGLSLKGLKIRDLIDEGRP